MSKQDSALTNPKDAITANLITKAVRIAASRNPVYGVTVCYCCWDPDSDHYTEYHVLQDRLGANPLSLAAILGHNDSIILDQKAFKTTTPQTWAPPPAGLVSDQLTALRMHVDQFRYRKTLDAMKSVYYIGGCRRGQAIRGRNRLREIRRDDVVPKSLDGRIHRKNVR